MFSAMQMGSMPYMLDIDRIKKIGTERELL